MGFDIGSIFGGGGNEAQDTKTEPWEPMQPYLLDAAAQAKGLYNSGGPNYYPNATYVPFSAQSQAAMQLGQNRALFGSQFDQPAGNVAMQNMQGNSPYTMSGVNALGMAGLGAGQLNATAQGAFLNSNPYLDQTFAAAARGLNTQYNNQVMPGVNATFGSGGRTGSNAHMQSMDMANQNYGNAMGDMAAQIYGGNYQAERGRQMDASSSLGNLGMGIASGFGSLGAQNFAQQMGGAALGQNLAQNDWQNIDALGRIGQQVEGKAGQMLGDYQDRFNFYQNRPEQQLQQYTNLLNGNPATNASQTNVNNNNGSATMDFAKAATMAFLMSDARLKTNVRKVGEHNGFNWYNWTWNKAANAIGLSGDSEGVIAQEVEEIAPHLVGEIGGYKAVNYAGVL